MDRASSFPPATRLPRLRQQLCQLLSDLDGLWRQRRVRRPPRVSGQGQVSRSLVGVYRVAFRRAIELNPNSGDTYDSYGLMLSAVGRYDEALAAQRRAHELDPIAHRHDAATTLMRAGRYDEALRLASRIIELEPEFAMPYATQGWAYLLSGNPDLGIASLERATALAPDGTLFLAQLGQAYGRAGRTREAREVLGRLEELSRARYVSPYHLAYVYAGLGEDETAMDWLERAYEERAGGIYGIKGSFLFNSLRDHPRFRALLRRMNLGDT